LTNWPSNSDVAERALQELQNSHRVVPLAAYDLGGQLIHPNQYRQKLQGALVLVRFFLTHWFINARRGQSAIDTFSADVVTLRMLDPAPGSNRQNPRKRKVLSVDPFDYGVVDKGKDRAT
jgi:hypothetical protein